MTPLIVQMLSSRTPSPSTTPPRKSHAPIVPDLMANIRSRAMYFNNLWEWPVPAWPPFMAPVCRTVSSHTVSFTGFGCRLHFAQHISTGLTPTHVKHRTAYLARCPEVGWLYASFLTLHRTSRAAVSRTADGKPFPHAQVAACIP